MAEKENDIEKNLKGKEHFLDMVRILVAFKERFGPDVVEVLDKLTAERSFKDGEELAKSLGSNTIEDMIQALWVSAIPLGVEYTSEKAENSIQMKCTRCHIHDMAKELGLEEWAYHMFCAGDPYFIEGFNPNMGFTRTKSLMEGHDCCNHYFFMKVVSKVV